jgi:outer membrane receptor protein involved in Fe transport
LDATFREALALPSPNNPIALDGEVFVSPGDRLPLIPSRLLKAGVKVSMGSKLSFGGEVLAGSDFHMRGDEGNDLARIGDYAVLNLRAEYLVSENVRLFLNVDNVLDEEYQTFGLFGGADEVLGDDFEDGRFFSPAAPRAAWLGVRVGF